MRFRRVLALLGSIAQIWLAASDLHLNPFDTSSDPSLFGSDTNLTLYRSTIAEMKRAVPDPAVVVLPGDFFAHSFANVATGNGAAPNDAGLRTMRLIAGDFARAYPHARFALALGNNDVPCGDYHSAQASPYMKAVARIWAPLVNRAGASPDFQATFARGGYYASMLPQSGLRLIALDTVVYSLEYRGDCNGTRDAAAAQLDWLRAQLASTPHGTRNVVLMHIPPGYDAFSTQIAHGLVAWPFLDGNGARLASLLALPASRVAFGIAGHAHHFDVRLAGGVPLVVLGSVSPIYHNNPAFYALRVGGDGTLLDVKTYAFDEDAQEWQPPHSFDADWRAGRLDAASLVRLHAALGADDKMRERWDAQTVAWPEDPSEAWGQWNRGDWAIAWCAQTILGPGFEQCAGIERRTGLGIALLTGFGVVVAAIVLGIAALLFRLWRRRRIVADT